MIQESDIATPSDEDAARLQRFLADTTLFLAPDPAIMNDHKLAPRSEAEEEALRTSGLTAHEAQYVRGRLIAGLDEGFNMVTGMGAAPGAKWGDLVTGIYTASGDMVYAGTSGVLGFSAMLHYPLRFINKYWRDEPTVGLRDGDAFTHNDARYGNIHNTDQSLLMPVFWEGELLAWVVATVHEGENGAIEPGGMPSLAESPYDEGLKMCPFKIVENFKIKRDLLTFLQNSVREPKLQYEDLKVKLFTCMRMRERVLETIREVGREKFIAALRRSMEDVEAEVRRRISELPDGTVRVNLFIDSTLREMLVYKLALAITVEGDRMTLDFRGSSPQFSNRSINCVLGTTKAGIATSFLQFIWPDLAKSTASISPLDVVAHKGSIFDCTDDVPNAQSLQPLMRTTTLIQAAMPKLLFSIPVKQTKVVAPWYNQIACFLYGGISQHHEFIGNICADLNGMGGGARPDLDGEDSVSPLFAAMADIGEQELIEEEVPFVQLVSKKMLRDNQAFGKYRGGMGYEILAAMRGSPLWGFMAVCTGSKISPVPGLFGGYGSPAYPLCKIKGANLFETFRNEPERFSFEIVDLMNEQPIPGARYSTHHMGMGFELAAEGEAYMVAQGTGGAYGDVLERAPDAVIGDLEKGLISHDVAREIYRVVYDAESLVVDEAATREERAAEREARKRRGVPYREFVETWNTAEPPEYLPYYGSWGDDPDALHATVWSPAGPARVTMRAPALTPLFLPNPKDLEIARLEAELAQLRADAAR